ncbi:hypothetical protein BH09BAC5_BH09BAC5_03090 [soil metagenome]
MTAYYCGLTRIHLIGFDVSKMTKKRLVKILKYLTAVFVIFPVVVILFISPITKYLIEKYDVKYTGREIKLSWAYVNPFTGYIHLSNLKIFEAKSDSVFLSVAGVSSNFEVWKLFSGNYQLSELKLDHPVGILVKDTVGLNIDDIIKKFSPDSTALPKAPVHFSMESIIINEGEFHYRDTATPVNYFIKNVNFESSGVYWNRDTIAAKFSFIPGIGSGDIKGDFTINTKNLNYRFATVVKKYSLDLIQQYLAALVNYGTFRASIDADLQATGNFLDAKNLDAKGLFAVNDFHFGKDSAEDYAAFDQLTLDIKRLSPKSEVYLFDSISLLHPFFNYERYDHLDNVQRIFGKEGSNITAVNGDPQKFNLVIEIAKYVKKISENFLASYYKIKRLAIYNGDMRYADYSMNEKFSIAANPLTIIADSIDKNNKRVDFTFKMGIKPYGDATVLLSINPVDSSEFDMSYHLQKIPTSMFNPYLISYTSFPMDRGSIELLGKWEVRNDNIQSTNHLIVIDPRIGVKVKRDDQKKIPMSLVMAFIRERGNVIDYEIPITGNLKNPNFHLKDVLLDLLKNIFIKPPTTPYQFEVRDIQNTLEKSQSLKWEMRQIKLNNEQIKFVKNVSDFLNENPAAAISVQPIEYSSKEKEYILFFEAKKKYFLLVNKISESNFNADDSSKVDKMSPKDSLFVRYLTAYCSDSMLFTVQDKCYRFLGPGFVSQKLKVIEQKREAAFRMYFIQNGTNSRVKFNTTVGKVPYNGFSTFVISYKGEIPESLTAAYDKMELLNSEAPRSKYFNLRQKVGHVFGN